MLHRSSYGFYNRESMSKAGERSDSYKALPFVGFKSPGSKSFRSWNKIPTDRLVTPDYDGGLLPTGRVQETCCALRPHFHRPLRARRVEGNKRSGSDYYFRPGQ